MCHFPPQTVVQPLDLGSLVRAVTYVFGARDKSAQSLSLSRREGGPGMEGAAGISTAFRGRGHGILT